MNRSFRNPRLPSPGPRPQSLGPSHAFTLVELLVVVAIIVILISILMPGMEKAIAQAQRAKCLANVRSWTMGMKQYSMDNRGEALWWDWYDDARRNFWSRRLASYMGQPSHTQGDPSKPVDDPLLVNVCPSTAVVTTGGSMNTTWNAYGSLGSYGLNNYTTAYVYANYDQAKHYRRYDRAPGNAVFIGDSIWVDSSPNPAFPYQGNNPPTGSNIDGDGGLARFCMNRHLKTTNLGYVDCSATSVAPGDLWMQNWYLDNPRTSYYQGDYFK